MGKWLVILAVVLWTLPGTSFAQFPDTLDLETTPADITIWGARAFDGLGSSMASGDIDGDGLVDLVVVACNAEPLAGARQGETYIIWGAELADSGTIDLLTDTNVTRIFGNPGDDDLGCGVACGDFNNDDLDDILLGQPMGGKTYVILGQTNFPDTLDLALTPPNVTINGWSSPAGIGSGLCACDMNGDGYDEIIVATTGLANAQVYVIQGDSTFQTIYEWNTAEPGLTRIIDTEGYRGTGTAMACADIDDDGYEDLLLGAPGIGLPTADGRATVLYGHAALADTILLEDPSPLRMKRVLPEYLHGALGQSVAYGDVNGDQKWDLVVSAQLADPLGCYNCGEVYVLYGVNNMPDSIPVDSTTLPIGRVIGYGSAWQYGVKIFCSDIDGNGRDDIFISSWPSSSIKAEVAIVNSFSSLPDSIFIETDTTNVSRIVAETPGNQFGHALTAANFNQNGPLDAAIGATVESPQGRNRAGAVYIIFGDSVPTSVKPTTVPPIVLRQNYPNPFSAGTVIDFELRSSSPVTLTIYNIAGQRVAELKRPAATAGPQRINWDGRDERGHRVASGIYFYRVETKSSSVTQKLVILR